jgi:tetraacyldisaccharide 4'-kinase
MILLGIKYIISKIYLLIIQIRYWLYRHHFLGSTHFDLPIICVGNLSVGGTGKTPMVEYLIKIIAEQYKIGIISRGYKRNTTGFIKLKTSDLATQVGDEPLLLKLKHPYVEVAVGEQRIYAIPNLLSKAPEIQAIIMDDGFQHLSVKAQLNILISKYDTPFWNDKILPLGTLREPIDAKKRADIFIISNCPKNISDEEMKYYIEKIEPLPAQKIFFSSIIYNNIYALFYNNNNPENQLILITGIADATNIYEELNQKHNISHYEFEDHHHYTEKDFESIFQQENSKNWICTEKDAVKLMPFQNWFFQHKVNIWVQPISIEIKSIDNENFNHLIYKYLDYYFDK